MNYIKLGQIAPVAKSLELNIQVVAQSYANDLGLNIEGYFKTAEEIQAETQEAQNQEAMNNIAPELIRQAGSMIQNEQKSQNEQGNINEQHQKIINRTILLKLMEEKYALTLVELR